MTVQGEMGRIDRQVMIHTVFNLVEINPGKRGRWAPKNSMMNDQKIDLFSAAFSKGTKPASTAAPTFDTLPTLSICNPLNAPGKSLISRIRKLIAVFDYR